MYIRVVPATLFAIWIVGMCVFLNMRMAKSSDTPLSEIVRGGASVGLIVALAFIIFVVFWNHAHRKNGD